MVGAIRQHVNKRNFSCKYFFFKFIDREYKITEAKLKRAKHYIKAEKVIRKLTVIYYCSLTFVAILGSITPLLKVFKKYVTGAIVRPEDWKLPFDGM